MFALVRRCPSALSRRQTLTACAASSLEPPCSVRRKPSRSGLTAPSFGPVHNRPATRPCRCGTRHPEGAAELGTPLNPDSYDYAAAVLFDNHAGQLWQRFTTRLRREIAASAGLSQREFSWVYAGQGHSPGEAALAASIARDIQLNRETAREALRDQLALAGVAA